MYCETENSTGERTFQHYTSKEALIMCGFNLGNNGCCWILILILLFSVCGGNNGISTQNDGCGCGCGNNNNNGCGCGC